MVLLGGTAGRPVTRSGPMGPCELTTPNEMLEPDELFVISY